MAQSNEHALRILGTKVAQLSIDLALMEQAKAESEAALQDANDTIARLQSDQSVEGVVVSEG